jgi:hypothetical protein
MKLVLTGSNLDKIVDNVVRKSVAADRAFFVSWRVQDWENAGQVELGARAERGIVGEWKRNRWYV